MEANLNLIENDAIYSLYVSLRKKYHKIRNTSLTEFSQFEKRKILIGNRLN